MRLKVFFIRDYSKIPGSALKIDKKDHENIIDYEFKEDYHCFKILNNHSIDEKGIEKEDHEFINSIDFFENNAAKRLVSLAFLFINAKNGNVFSFNYANQKLERFLLKHFMLTQIDTKVDPEKLKTITKIEVKLRNDPQLNFLYENIPPEGIDLIKALEMQDKSIETFTARYEFKKDGAIFSKKGLKNVIGKYENLIIEGMDDHDNIIKIKDGVQLEINIDIKLETFEDAKAILFSTILDKIKEKEKDALYAYKNNAK